MGSGLRERVLKELSGPETLHLRDLLRRLNVPISELKPVLEEMVKDGLVEKFSHGGYTFYRITEGGKGLLLKLETESKILKDIEDRSEEDKGKYGGEEEEKGAEGG